MEIFERFLTPQMLPFVVAVPAALVILWFVSQRRKMRTHHTRELIVFRRDGPIERVYAEDFAGVLLSERHRGYVAAPGLQVTILSGRVSRRLATDELTQGLRTRRAAYIAREGDPLPFKLDAGPDAGWMGPPMTRDDRQRRLEAAYTLKEREALDEGAQPAILQNRLVLAVVFAVGLAGASWLAVIILTFLRTGEPGV